MLRVSNILVTECCSWIVFMGMIYAKLVLIFLYNEDRQFWMSTVPENNELSFMNNRLTSTSVLFVYGCEQSWDTVFV